MEQLTDLPNIGKTLACKLESIGITSASELKSIGSKQALIKISTLENSGVCLNMLFALEGAIQGIRWHGLNNADKQDLKLFYHSLKKNLI